MKVIKTAVYRITTAMQCGCTAMQEFTDADYKKPVGKEPTFEPCKKHKGQPGLDILEMVLTERVGEEAEKHVAAPTQPEPRPGASATVGEDGSLVMRVPIRQSPVGTRANTGVAPLRLPSAPITGGAPVVGAKTASVPPPPPPPRPTTTTVQPSRLAPARTGPVKAYNRPTASTPKGPVAPTLRQAEAEEEPDLFDQNDPDYMNGR